MHKYVHLYTWKMGESRTIIDFMIYNEKLNSLVKNTRIMRGAECGMDHYLVVSKVELGRKL